LSVVAVVVQVEAVPQTLVVAAAVVVESSKTRFILLLARTL